MNWTFLIPKLSLYMQYHWLQVPYASHRNSHSAEVSQSLKVFRSSLGYLQVSVAYLILNDQCLNLCIGEFSLIFTKFEECS